MGADDGSKGYASGCENPVGVQPENPGSHSAASVPAPQASGFVSNDP